jgi:hypothetical protein
MRGRTAVSQSLNAKPPYMLKVEMQDDGVVVHNIEPHVRPEDPVWLTLNPIARDKLMPLASFTAQVVPLQNKAAAAWPASRTCRLASL